jgi:SAM-dependent methyltransferase
MSTEETDTHVCDTPVKEALAQMFNVKTAVDIGCGNGEYTKYLIEHGIDCIGYDGSPLTPELTGGLCFIKDFSEPVDIGKFDLVISLEVGEHIPKEYEHIFIDNLCNATNKFIVLSWAIIGQRSFDITKFAPEDYPVDMHVNCQDNYYVISEMRKRNLELNVEMTRYLRSVCTFPWFKNTILIFEK